MNYEMHKRKYAFQMIWGTRRNCSIQLFFTQFHVLSLDEKRNKNLD